MWRRVAGALLHYGLPLVILAAGASGGWYLYETRPKATRKKRPKAVALVEVMRAERSAERVIVRVMGTVMPAREVLLRPQVSGRLVKVTSGFVPGGHYRAGDTICQIEQQDYEFEVTQKRSLLVNAEHDHQIELGRQEIAKREWELHSTDDASPEDLELALRKPQLRKAEAAVAAAKAALAQSELDLERTTIKAPFNAIVIEKLADVGAEVTPQTTIARLAGTDDYWIQASVPMDRVKWIDIPSKNGDLGAVAHVRIPGAWDAAATRQGRVVRLLSDLEREGRMARVLIVVRDPLSLQNPELKQPPLLIGCYAQAEIEGTELAGVFRIPRTALREGDQLWLMNDQRKLEIRPVDLAWRDRHTVLVRGGISDGDKIVTSDIATPVVGLEIRTEEQLRAERERKAKQKTPGELPRAAESSEGGTPAP